jgi:hypothetical protein
VCASLVVSGPSLPGMALAAAEKSNVPEPRASKQIIIETEPSPIRQSSASCGFIVDCQIK